MTAIDPRLSPRRAHPRAGRGARAVRPLIAVAALSVLVACGKAENTADVQYEYRTGYDIRKPKTDGGVFSGSDGVLSFLGGERTPEPGESIAVNAYLWRAALDTVSFMPTLQADPLGGVILKDWYSPDGNPEERFKVDLYITSRELSPSALRVQVFRQARAGGAWVDQPVAPATSTELEDAILARARELRRAGT